MAFIEGCLTMLEAQHKPGYYHDNMNHNMYMKWLMEKLIPNLPVNSVVVMTTLHITTCNWISAQTQTIKKAEMEAWLLSKKIPLNEKMLKVEL